MLRMLSGILIFLLAIGMLFGDLLNFFPSESYRAGFPLLFLILTVSTIFVIKGNRWLVSKKTGRESNAAVVLLSFFWGYVALLALAYPLPFAVNAVLASDASIEAKVASKRGSHFSKGCDYVIDFAESRALFPRHDLCIGEKQFNAVQIGDVLELHGAKSVFGIQVRTWNVKR